MVLSCCRRGSVIPICLYLLVGRYMKERISGLRNESSKTNKIGLFQRITTTFPLTYLIIYGLFEIISFNFNQRCFLISHFFSEQIEEPNGLNSSLAATKRLCLS